MGDVKASVIVDLAGNLPRQAPRFAQQLRRMGQDGSQQMGLLSRSVASTSRALDRLGNRYTALITGGAAARLAKGVADLDSRMNQLGLDSQLNGAALQRWKAKAIDSIQSVAINTAVSSDEIISAYDAIIQKTGDLDFADKLGKEMAITIGATGAAGESIGELFAEFQKAGFGVDEVRDSIGAMVASGQLGSFTLREMASLGPRIFAAYGPKNVAAIKDMSAVLQVLRDSTGSSEQATTSFEALFRVLRDGKKSAAFEKNGIKVFDKNKNIRPLNNILKETVVMLANIQKQGGNAQISLSNLVPDEEARRGLTAFLNKYLETGNFDRFDQLLQVNADFNELVKDNADRALEFNAQLTMLAETGKKFAYINLSKPLKELAEWTSNLKPGDMEEFFDTALTGVKILGAVVVANKGLRLLSRIGGGIKSFKTGGIAGGLGAAGATPVWVVNMPGTGMGMPDPGGLPTSGGFSTSTKRSNYSLLKNQRLGSLAAGGAPALAAAAGYVGLAGAAGYGVGTLAYKAIDETKFADSLGRSVARVLALLGSDDAQAALDSERRSRSLLQEELKQAEQKAQQQLLKAAPITGKFIIEMTGPGKVTGMSINTPGIELEAEHRLGPVMRVPG